MYAGAVCLPLRPHLTSFPTNVTQMADQTVKKMRKEDRSRRQGGQEGREGGVAQLNWPSGENKFVNYNYCFYLRHSAIAIHCRAWLIEIRIEPPRVSGRYVSALVRPVTKCICVLRRGPFKNYVIPFLKVAFRCMCAPEAHLRP